MSRFKTTVEFDTLEEMQAFLSRTERREGSENVLANYYSPVASKPLESESTMSQNINARIQASLNPKYRRSVSLPDGNGRFTDYFIDNDNEPNIQPGETVGVTFTYGDQFARILPTVEGLAVGSVKNPRFVWIMPCTLDQYPDVPDLIGRGPYTLWDRQEKKAVVEVSRDYANAVCLETVRMVEGTKMVDGQPFTNLEDWFNTLSNDALDSEGIPTTKMPFTHV